MFDLLLSKLMPPRRGGVIDRPGLTKKITGCGDHQITLLIAPAGYGKTTSMLQAADACGRTLVWYQLDAYDNDPAVFLRYLAAGMARQLDGFGSLAEPLLTGGLDGRLRLLVTAFVNELSRQDSVPFLLVLDDYHEIDSLFVHRFIQDFLAHLPQHVHVMLASRTALPFSLSRLRAGLLTVGTEELRFTEEEVRLFLAAKAPALPPPAWQAWQEKVNGWPAAVRFAADALDDPGTGRFGGETSLHDYLAAEVLSRQPQAMIEFMQIIAVLDELTPEACDKLLERNDSQQRLRALAAQNVFITRLAGPVEAYRYQQLFREFLLEGLEDRKSFWQIRAGDLALQAGDPNMAIDCFHAAAAKEKLIAAIVAAGRPALLRGQWHTLERWLHYVEQSDLAAEPWLRFYQAAVETYNGRLEMAEQYLNGLDSRFTERHDQEGLLESRLLQARIWRCRGRFAQSLELLKQVTALMPPPCREERFDLILEQSLCLLVLGRLREAEAVLLAAFHTAERIGNKHLMTHLLEGLGTISYMLGDYPKAMRQYRQGAELLPERVLPGYYAQDSIATIYQDWGELDKALEYAKRNIAIKENFGLNEALPSAYLQLAGLYADRREWELAEQCHRHADTLLQENDGEQFFQALNLVFWAHCMTLQGKLSGARLKVEKALAMAEPQAGLALAVCRAVGAAVFAQTGSLPEAKAMLAAAIADLSRMEFRRGLCYAYAMQAWLYSVEGDPAAVEFSRRTLELAARMQCQQLFLTNFAILQSVLAAGLETGTETAFVQRILVQAGEMAVPVLAGLTGHHSPAVRLRLIAPLAEIGGKQALAVLRQLIDDPDPEICREARLVSGQMKLPVVVGKLSPCADDLLRITMLGSFKVFCGDAEMGKGGWRTAKTQDLLAYLIHRREPVSRDRIQEDLWPNLDIENAVNIFHVTLHRLRKMLAKTNCPDILFYSDRHYGLDLDRFSCDTQQFQDLVAAGFRHDSLPEERADYLEQAAALYRGDYLEDMDYLWLLHCREKLKQLYTETRMSLAQHYLAAQSYTQAIAHLQIVEETDPFAEDAHALLIQAYIGQGSRAAAIRQYQKAETILQTELGLSPSPSLHGLYLKLVKR